MPRSLLSKSFLSLSLSLGFVATNIVNKHVAGDPFREGKLMLFLLAILFLGCAWVAERFDPWLAAVIGIASAEWVWSNGPVYGIMPTFGVLGFLCLGHAASKYPGWALFILRASSALQAIFCLLQMVGFNLWGSRDPDLMIYGSMGHPIVVGAWFAAVAPLAWAKWSKWEFLAYVFLCLWSGSTMAILALLSTIGFVAYRKGYLEGKWGVSVTLVTTVTLICGVIWLPQIEFFSLSGRMLPWKAAFEHIIQSPWVGYGPGSWNGRYADWGLEYARVWDFVHNDWLQLAFETGIPSSCIALIATWSILKRIDLVYGCVTIAILVNALGAFPLHLAPIAFLFCVSLALGLTQRDNEKKDQDGPPRQSENPRALGS